MKTGFAFLMLVLLLEPAAASITDAKILNTETNQTVILSYQTLSNSYLDGAGTNPDVKLRIYSNASGELAGKFVGLAYRGGNTVRIISDGPLYGNTLLEPLGQERSNGTHYYAETSDDFLLSSTRAVYPGILSAVITNLPHPETNNDTFTVSANDTFIDMNPEEDGWLRGFDGAGQFSGDNPGENQTYGSYYLNISSAGSSVSVTVNFAYYNATVTTIGNTNYTVNKKEISIDTNMLVLALVSQNGTVLDSTVTSIKQNYSATGLDLDPDDSDDTVTLCGGSYNGTAYVYVNGIREAEAMVTGGTSSNIPLKLGWNLISLPLLIL